MRLSAAALCLALAGSAAAAPAPSFGSWMQDIAEKVISNIEAIPDAVDDKIAGTISASDLTKITYYAEYAAAAYCAPTTPTLSCLDNICPALQPSKISKVLEFADGHFDSTGFVGVDKTRSEIVITFRGSSSLENWMANMLMSREDVPQWCEGCEVHEGFWKAYNEQPQVLETVERLAGEYKNYTITAVGHSLGGALATLAAVELRVKGHTVDLYSYGAPRVGNREFSEFVTESGRNFRVTHREDPVPRLPPLSMGYFHISPEYHIFAKDTDITPTDVNVLEGVVNMAGNSGAELQVDTEDHRNYLLPVKISSCGRPGDEKNVVSFDSLIGAKRARSVRMRM